VVERRLVGYLAIILVITTLIALLVFQVSEDEVVRILASRTPDNVPGGRPGSPSYSIDLMSVQDVPDLVIELSFIQNITRMPLVKLWNETTSREYEDMLANVPRLSNIIKHLENAAAALGVESLVDEYEIEKADRKLYVIDLTDAIIAFAGEETLRTVYTVYAFNVYPDGHVSVFGGYRDFFLYRRSYFLDKTFVVGEIKIQTPTESHCFRSEDAQGGLGSCNSVLDAPIGRLKATDLSSGDRVHIEVTLNTINMFGHSGILEVITTETGHGPGPSIVEWIGASGT
jgi:hypothetical protein